MPRTQWNKGVYTELGEELDWRTGKSKMISINEWRDPELLGKYLFECIEELETAGMYATVDDDPESLTCMDYILKRATRLPHTKKHASRKTKENARKATAPMFITVHPDSYHGSNTLIRDRLRTRGDHPEGTSYGYAYTYNIVDSVNKDRINYGLPGESFEEFAYRYYGMRYDLLTAIAEFYFKNSYTNPESSHCSATVEDPEHGWIQTGVNCLSQFIQADQNYVMREGYYGAPNIFEKYIGTDPFINLVNGGLRCSKFSHTTYNNVDIYNKTSCLELALERELANVQMGGKVGQFARHMSKFNMSLDCLGGDSFAHPIPCMQKLIETRDPDNYHRLLMAIRGTDYSGSILKLLAKSYKFEKMHEEDLEESTAIDYMINDGYNLDLILKYQGSESLMVREDLCKLPDAASTMCLSKLLVNLKNDVYEKRDQDTLNIYSALDRLDYIDNYIARENCNDGINAVPCISHLIDIVSKKGALTSTLKSIVGKYPISGLDCINTVPGTTYATTNCMDKIIGMSSESLMDAIKGSETLLDVDKCFDWNGDRMGCFDKLFQRHEMWIYGRNRADEIEMTGEDESANKFNEFRRISNLYYVWNDPGFNAISSEYDIGSLKTHSPSKMYVSFASAIKDQIADYELDEEVASAVGATQSKLDYSRELLASVSSDKPSRETSIVPRIYKLADVYGNIDELNKIGFGALVNPDRPVQVSYNMFECKDDENRTISCMQKHIDEVGRQCKTGTAPACKIAVSSVVKMKDVFKDGMCTDYGNAGEKIPCIVYAFKKLPAKFDSEAYTEIISRKDFGKARDYQVAVPGGTTKALSELICSHVSIEKISKQLLKMHPFSVEQQHAIQNQHPSHDGAALKLYSNCTCAGVADPMERRMCIDMQCFREYVRGRSNERNWAVDFLGLDNSPDAYRRAFDERDRNDPEDYGNKIAKNLTIDGVRDAYYPYVYNDSTDYYGLAGVYNVDYNPANYHITNVERVDAAGKITPVFNLRSVLRDTMIPAVQRTKGMVIPMVVPEINDTGDYATDANGNPKEIKGKAKIEFVDLVDPTDPENDDYKFEIRFSYPDNRFLNGKVYWTKFYPAIEAFGGKGFFGRSDLKDVVIRYKSERELVKQMLTRQKAAEGTSSLKLVVSNRPADYMRASTCQSWRSCLHSDLAGTSDRSPGFNSNALAHYVGTGGYVAYLASDEFSPTWISRAFMLPLMKRKKGDPERSDARDVDYNNNFRINKVYGLTSHKDLLRDVLSILLREKGYNKDGLARGDSSWWHTDENIVRLQRGMRKTALDEAYASCVENLAITSGLITLPGGTTIETPRSCTQFLQDIRLVPADIFQNAHDRGLISDRTYGRVKALDRWLKYDDHVMLFGEIDDATLRSRKWGGTTRLTYEKPLTVPQ